MSRTLPGYKRIAGEIIQRIHNGEYSPKSFLPSENKLSREFEVTRSTIRKALNILKQQGTIESHQGKGYQVKSLFWEQSLLHFYSFGHNIAESVVHPRTRLIDFAGLNCAPDIDEYAGVEVWKITRLRLIEGVPLILETSYLPVKYVPGLEPGLLQEESLYTVLEENGIQVVKAREYLEPVLPSQNARELLEIKPDLPLFATTRRTYDTKQNLVEVRESLIRGDHFRFSVEMTL